MMNKQLTSLMLGVMLLFSQSALAQLDSIFEQGAWRTFIVHLPSNYQLGNKYPLVINLHGLNSNATQQENYTAFNRVADAKGFIVVYPNANNGSWVINGTNDVDFVSHLIDTMRSRYSCNNCLFITGMSQGGFLTYKLACSLPQSIKAIAVVSGNISQSLQNTCTISGGLPVMHFHGTADSLVKYSGVIGIPPVNTTINWWVNQNNCNATPLFTALQNLNSSDNSTVEKYYYGGGINGSEVTFFKIINGGHTWPGASPVPPFGFTNQDINASDLIGGFFSQHCSVTLGLNEFNLKKPQIYPNPFFNSIHLNNASGNELFRLTNTLGQTIWTGKNIEIQDFATLLNGVYFLTIYQGNYMETVKLTKQPIE